MEMKFPEFVTLDEAWKLLEKTFRGYSAQFTGCVDIKSALGLVLTQDIAAPRNVPHYAASAVDGYALAAGETAGASAASPVRIAKYAWMNTGAALPEWADAVLMVEDSSLDGSDLVVYKPLVASANVRPLGEDVMAGQIIAREGDIVTPALVSLFLCAGIEEIPVKRKVKTVFIPTGDEIIPQEEWIKNPVQKSGTAAESNSLFIASSMKNWGYEIDIAPVLPDVPEILEECIKRKIADYDLVLVGAGSAKGKRDHTAEVFQKLGEMLFRGVRAKPGRPAMAAKIAGKPVICCPGFPMSTAVALWALVYPLIKMLSGSKAEYRELLKEAAGTISSVNASLLFQHSSPQGIEECLRVKAARVGDKLYAYPLTGGASVLLSLAEADGLSFLPAQSLENERGASVNIWMTRKVDFEKRVLFQGSDDPAIQRLVTPIRRRGGDLICRSVGSMGGLAALSRGECHIAAAHLLDTQNGTYNDSFIKRFSAGKVWHRFLVFHRTQGIIVQRGNPLNIRSFADLCSCGAVIANRQPGAGTRVLLDHLLKLENRTTIAGYEQICATHMEASNRVLTGLADAALGIKSAADALALDFVPITEEPYELVVPDEYINHAGIEILLESLKDAEWRGIVENMGGYRF